MAEKISVKIMVFLYDFGLFQAWNFANLDNKIKKLGSFFAKIVKTTAETILSVRNHIKILVLLTKCGPYKTYAAGLNTPD